MCCGCRRRPQEFDWARIYSDARHRRAIHDKSANAIAERGLRETGNLDPNLHYRFRLLTANIGACSDSPRALALLDTPPPHSPEADELEAERQFNIGLALACSHNYRKAEDQLASAQKLASQSKPELLANIVATSAWMAGEQKTGDEEKLYLSALNLARKYNNPVEASALNSLALISLSRKRYVDAIDRFSASLEEARKWQDRFVEEVALGNLGNVYLELGDFARAEEYSKPAAEIAGKIDQPGDQETWLINLGRAYQADARQLHADAEASYAEAVSIATRLKDTGAAANCLHNLAQLALKEGDIAKAQDYVRRVVETHPSGELALFLTLDQAEIAEAQQDFAKAEQLLQAASQASPPPPFLLRWRFYADLAQVYAAEHRIDLADRWFRKAVDTAEDAFTKLEAGNQRISFLDSAPFYSSYITFLIERNKPAEALAVAELGRARTLAEASGKRTQQKAGADIRKVQHRLKDKEVVLAYFLGVDKSYLWAITHSQLKLFLLPSLKELYNKIHAYNKEIQDLGKLGDSALGASLYQILVGPAAPMIAPDSLVTIIPNRYLYHLDFDTLVVGGSQPHYWIEDVNIQVCSAITLMANPPTNTTLTSRKILLIGDPVQAMGAPQALKHAGEEIARVQSHFRAGERSVIRGEEAVPESFLGNQPGKFRFIHFAAHGIANQNTPLESAIVLSPDRGNKYKLEAPDILKARLNARLVTVSSCESAGTRTYDAEGLVGLAWTFMRAGAHQVVAGLWDVDDATTPQLMDDFYTELNKGDATAVALRKAKLAMLRSDDVHKRPYYWAALQLYTRS